MEHVSNQDASAEHLAFLAAIKILGSQDNMAKVCGCTTPNIWQLVKKKRMLPPQHVLKVEAATGIPRTVLRPDIYPPEIEVGPEAPALAA